MENGTIGNLIQTVNIDRMEIIKNKKIIFSIPKKDVTKGNVEASMDRYVDYCSMIFNNKPYNAFHELENSEVKLYAMSEGSSTEFFYGFIEKYDRQWDKKNDFDFIRFRAFSFAAILSQKMVTDLEINYKHGLGEIIKKLVGSEFDTENISNENKKGSVYFDNVSVLDALRIVAYTRGWCVKFDGKVIRFQPCQKPIHSGKTINMADIDSGSMKYGRDISDILDRTY